MLRSCRRTRFAICRFLLGYFRSTSSRYWTWSRSCVLTSNAGTQYLSGRVAEFEWLALGIEIKHMPASLNPPAKLALRGRAGHRDRAPHETLAFAFILFTLSWSFESRFEYMKYR